MTAVTLRGVRARHPGGVLVRLSNGLQVVIRPIRAADKPRLQAALLRLSPESSRARFLAPKSRFTSAELRYLTEVDGCVHYALVATLLSDPDRIIGVGRYVRLADEPDTAEMAVLVGDAYQGLGLGRRLALLLADHARAGGLERIGGLMLSDNKAAHRLLAAVTERMQSTSLSGGVDEVRGELAA